MNEQTLVDIKRSNFQLNDIENVAKECNKIGLIPIIELILGLPGETKESWKDTYCKILSLDAEFSGNQAHLLTVLENSEINNSMQRKMHGIKTVTVTRSVPNGLSFDNDILEQEKIVCATNTMPVDDLVESFMFTYIVTMFHNIGWAKIIIFYLVNNNIMSLNQIFSRLENCLINGDGHLSTEYHRVKSFFATFLSNGEYRKEHQNLINKTYAIHLASLADFYLNHEKVMEELRGVFNIEYTGLSKDIHDSLFDIQSALMYSNKKTYPHLIPDPYGIYGRAMNNEVASPSILKVEYLHDPIEDTDPEIVFLRLAIDRKRGRCTTHITIERTDEKNVH